MSNSKLIQKIQIYIEFTIVQFLQHRATIVG